MLNNEIDWTETPTECPLCGDTGCTKGACDGYPIPTDSAGEETPMDVDGSAGWPGDGSGMDDLADYNANEADDYRDE